MALSRNFEVKSYPLYHLIMGRVRRETGNLQEALDSLQEAMKTCRAKKTVGRSGEADGERGGRGRRELGLSEVATVHLELVAVLSKLGKQVREGRGEGMGEIICATDMSSMLSSTARSCQGDAGRHK